MAISAAEVVVLDDVPVNRGCVFMKAGKPCNTGTLTRYLHEV